MVNLNVNIKGLKLKNPVMTASGTFGYGLEFEDFVNLSELGGIVVKGTTLLPREGNPYPRMAETPSGMLNAVGLQNKGVDYFIKEIYPKIKDLDTSVIVNVSGSTVADYVAVAEKLSVLDAIPAIELNISCPNVKEGGMAFGTSSRSVEEVVGAVRRAYDKTLIVKLSPNVTDITEIARAAESEGADSVSLINTLLGMAVDAEKRRPVLSTVTGGLSGACVKPVALRMVWNFIGNRCRGIFACRSNSRRDRNSQFHRPVRFGKNSERDRGVPRKAGMSFCSGDYRRAYRIVWEKTTVVMQKLFLSLFMGAILSACTVDVELSGREETGPMSRISDWWYGEEDNDTE